MSAFIEKKDLPEFGRRSGCAVKAAMIMEGRFAAVTEDLPHSYQNLNIVLAGWTYDGLLLQLIELLDQTDFSGRRLHWICRPMVRSVANEKYLKVLVALGVAEC